MADEKEPIGFGELVSFWRDEAKLYAFSQETRANALLIFLASVAVLIVLYLNPQWFGTAEDELKVRSIEFAVVLFFFPVLMALDMFFRGGQAGARLAARANERQTYARACLGQIISAGNELNQRNIRDPQPQRDTDLVKLSADIADWQENCRKVLRENLTETDAACFDHVLDFNPDIIDGRNYAHKLHRGKVIAHLSNLREILNKFDNKK